MIRRLIVGAAVVAGAAFVGVAPCPGEEPPNPGYQKRPVVWPPYYRRPFYYPPRNVQSGSFTRPYPYHLDYYRKQYGGGYEPYFGNLYGPPAIVGTQPFAFSAYPNSQPPAYQGPPLAAPMIECPHCQQPVQLLWQQPQAENEGQPATR